MSTADDYELLLTFLDGRVDHGKVEILPNCPGEPFPAPWQINRIIAPDLGIAVRQPLIPVLPATSAFPVQHQNGLAFLKVTSQDRVARWRASGR